jgi:hypothetical protein
MTFVKNGQIVGLLYTLHNICLTNENFYEFCKYFKVQPMILRKKCRIYLQSRYVRKHFKIQYPFNIDDL